jgi:uncharacterized protein YheU (UPF0270 family)
MKIPHQDLDPETLTRLLSEMVSRDGTDYGAVETPVEQKIAQARAQLDSGAAVLVFDPESETCSLLRREEYKE